jgi:hypothetical protein
MYTCCLNRGCERCYDDNLPACPECGTRNFFSDPDEVVVTAAARTLCEQIEYDAETGRREKLDEIAGHRPPRWYQNFRVWVAVILAAGWLYRGFLWLTEVTP